MVGKIAPCSMTLKERNMANQRKTIQEVAAELSSYIRIKAVSELTSMSRTTIWRKAKTEPDFPKPIKLSAGITVFKREDVLAWLESKEVA